MFAAIDIFKTNWRFRRTTYDLVRRDIKLRYLGSLLGRVWNILSPLAMIAIYTFVFSIVMGAKLGGLASSNRFSFVIYLCAGLLPWNATAEMVTRGTRTFLENAHLIKKVPFPLAILPSVVAGSAAVNFLISYLLYFCVYLAVGFSFTEHAVLLVPAFALQLVLCFGLVMILSALNVFFRDIENIVGILFMALFWVTPIVYQLEMVPERFRAVIYLNPFYYITSLYQDALFYQRWPSSQSLVIATTVSVSVFVLGAWVLQQLRPQIPDEI